MHGLLAEPTAPMLLDQGLRTPAQPASYACVRVSSFDHADSALIAAWTSAGTASPRAVASTHNADSSRAAPWAPNASSQRAAGTPGGPAAAAGSPSGPNHRAVWIALATLGSHPARPAPLASRACGGTGRWAGRLAQPCRRRRARAIRRRWAHSSW